MTASHSSSPLLLSDLRGAAALTTDAVLGVTQVVEAMHAGIASTRGLTAWVYGSVRGITRLSGGGVDALLGASGAVLERLGRSPGLESAHPGRLAVISALNGVFGDHLVATQNRLALPMTFRHQGQALVLQRAALAQQLPHAGPRLLVMIHGLCMNDTQWLRAGHHHGDSLAQALGYTPVHLRYNTGLSIAANGRALAQKLAQLWKAWPQAVERFAIVGHSMGGLVARSAIHQASTRTGKPFEWAERLDDLVCLGTPHLGAPLERAGHGLDRLLEAIPYAAPLARIGKARSAGITDLRDGRVCDRAPAGARRRQAPVVPLPTGTRCYAVAGVWTSDTARWPSAAVGDGLVTVASALGQHADPARCLAFPESHRWVVRNTGHLDLLSSPEVGAQLRRWLV